MGSERSIELTREFTAERGHQGQLTESLSESDFIGLGASWGAYFARLPSSRYTSRAWPAVTLEYSITDPFWRRVGMRGAAFRLLVPDRINSSTWFQPTLQGLDDLQSLTRQTWGDRDVATKPQFVVELLRFMIDALDSHAAPPSLAPLNEGGIQAEWHRGGLDVEVLFSPDREEQGVYVHDKATGEESEFPLDPALFVEVVGDRLSLTN
jgi:hypothetical protein